MLEFKQPGMTLETLEAFHQDQLYRNDPICFISMALNVTLTADQCNMITVIHSNNKSLHLNARQTGTTSITAAYFLWTAIFNPYYVMLNVSPNRMMARAFLDRVKEIWNTLPENMKEDIGRYCGDLIQFKNNAAIKSYVATPDVGRGMSISVINIDNFNGEETLQNLLPCLASTGGKCIVNISANKNVQKLWQDSIDGKTEFVTNKMINLGMARDFMSEAEYRRQYLCEFK